jgi:hypothetical protein
MSKYKRIFWEEIVLSKLSINKENTIFPKQECLGSYTSVWTDQSIFTITK